MSDDLQSTSLQQGGRGLNITAPLKLDSFAHATELQEDARLEGAVNCLSFDGNAATSFDFDGIGVLRDIQHNLGVPLERRCV